MLLEETERRIVHIKRDLEEHKLRAAPIKRVPFEILSNIFAICCQDGVLTAVRISAVCHRWRSTIIATPVAWVRVSNIIPSGLMSTVLGCSETRLLHVKILGICPKCLRDLLNKSCRHSTTAMEFLQPQTLQRIDCLHTPNLLISGFGTVFPTVRRLSLRIGTAGFIWVHQLTVYRFPALRSLDISEGLLSPVSLVPHLELPPLEELKFKADVAGFWVTLLRKCAKTLKRLDMQGAFLCQGATTHVVQFPILESLVIYDSVPATGTQILQAITPALTHYNYYRSTMVRNMARHEDVANVVHVRTTENFDLSAYPCLRILQIQGELNAVDIVGQLGNNPNRCPSLEIIQIQGTSWIGNANVQHCKQLLQVRNEMTGSNVKLIQDDIWHHLIPGCDDEACVSVDSTYPS
jgi:hypothetical protein